MDLFETATIQQKKKLLHSLIVTINIRNGETPKERKIEEITLIFKPQDIEALSIKNSFAATCVTIHRNDLRVANKFLAA